MFSEAIRRSTSSEVMVKEYDIVSLKSPMEVFTTLPEKFWNPENPYSGKPGVRLVPIGRPIQNPSHIDHVREKVKGQIEKILEFPGLRYPADIVTQFVNYVLPDTSGDVFVVPEGEYLVMHTSEDRDGITEIIARKLDENRFKDKVVVSFLQGSDRPGNLEKVEVVRNLLE